MSEEMIKPGQVLAYYYEKYRKPFYVQYQRDLWKKPWMLYPDEYEGIENQRQIFPDEIVIDAETSEETFLQKIREKLKPYSYTEWYSGGRGRHFHLFFPELADINDDIRPITKKILMQYILGEELFSSELVDKQRFPNKCLIQTEWAGHRKHPYYIKDQLCLHNVGINKIPSEVLEKIKNIKIDFVPAETLIATSPEITKMEESCSFIKERLERTDLGNRERFFLMATYLKLGDVGEARLREIISRQQNYNSSITDKIIESYKRQGKFYGVSCKTLVKEGYCNDTKCKLRKKVRL